MAPSWVGRIRRVWFAKAQRPIVGCGCSKTGRPINGQTSRTERGIELPHQVFAESLRGPSAEPRLDVSQIDLQSISKSRCSRSDRAHGGDRGEEVELLDLERPISFVDIETVQESEIREREGSPGELALTQPERCIRSG